MSESQPNLNLEEVLSWIAAYYLRIPHDREMSGVAAMTPERAVEAIADHLALRQSVVDLGFLHCCHGQGFPHFWRNRNPRTAETFLETCERHPERRKTSRRRSSNSEESLRGRQDAGKCPIHIEHKDQTSGDYLGDEFCINENGHKGDCCFQSEQIRLQYGPPAILVIDRLSNAIRKHRDQRADDRCWLDDQELYAALGDGVVPDNRVGDKSQMLANCYRFIENRCEGGKWRNYIDIERELSEAHRLLDEQGVPPKNYTREYGASKILVPETRTLSDRIKLLPRVNTPTILELEAKANEHGLSVYNIHYCRSGWGVTWYDFRKEVGPDFEMVTRDLGDGRTCDLARTTDNYKKALATYDYYPTPDEMLRAEMERLSKLPNTGESK